MIIKGDAKQLEWRSYIEWARDWTAINEIIENKDVHTDNQRVFALPSRLISKVFLFRWIYRGSAFAYANDPDFIPTSNEPKFWQRAIDAANEKYHILYRFQNDLIQAAQDGAIIKIPTGRQWEFKLKQNQKGEYYWPIRDIVNYPNQGFSADLMILVRRNFRNRLLEKDLWNQFVNPFATVHDDIETDVDNNPELCYNICIELEESFSEVNETFNTLYEKRFITPLAGEVYYGHNLLDLKPFKKEEGEAQFEYRDS